MWYLDTQVYLVHMKSYRGNVELWRLTKNPDSLANQQRIERTYKKKTCKRFFSRVTINSVATLKEKQKPKNRNDISFRMFEFILGTESGMPNMNIESCITRIKSQSVYSKILNQTWIHLIKGKESNNNNKQPQQ